MIYKTFDNDRTYLMMKFRNPELPAETGLANAELMERVLEFSETIKDQPLPVLKGKCFEFVCRNMQIDVNPHDCYPGFGCYDRTKRPLSVISGKNYSAVYEKYIKDTVSDLWLQRQAAGLHTIWPDFDHSVPEWDNIFALGFPGLLERVNRYREKHRKNGTLTAEVAAYFDGIEITLNGLLECLGRLIDFAEKNHGDNPRIQREIRSLKQMRTGAPKDTYDALMIIYLFFFFAEHIDNMQVRSLGNLDDTLDPFIRKDLAEGRFTKEEIREFIACFLMQWGSINNYWGHPFYLGGTAEDGSTLFNETSSLILEIFDELAIPTPKIQLKIAKNTPDWIFKQALRMVRDHNSSISFVSEENAWDLLINNGCTQEEARRCNLTGCYEISSRYGNGTGAGHVNILKGIELALNDGYSEIGDYHCRCNAMKLKNMKTFEDFLQAFFDYLDEIIKGVIKIALVVEEHLQEINPGQLYSSTVDYSLEHGVDAFSRGTLRRKSGILLCGIGTTVDALMAVKKMVFEQKIVTLEELCDILKKNWDGEEKLRLRMLHSKEKYGNGLPEVDAYADMIAKFCAERINKIPTSRGGTFSASGHCARQFIVQGEKTAATPDGRKSGDEFSKNLSPTMGADTNGITALSNSVCSMNYLDLPGDFPLDVMIHPATVQGEEGLEALKNYIRSHFAKGGMVIQFNIFDAKTLYDAQAHPEKYQNLQIRVCGWNVRFVELNEKEQNMYISRALRIAE